MTPALLFEVHTIRRLGAIEYLAVRDGSGRRHLAVAAVPGVQDPEVDALLRRIADSHRRITHPRVPRWLGSALVAGRPCVALDSAATIDLETLTRRAFAARLPIDIGGAAAFSIAFVETLGAVHDLTGQSAAPLCLGAASAANVLVAADGSFSILGWGHPVDAALRARLLATMPQSFLAPEVSLGAAPVAGSDLAAAVAFFHSFLYLGPLPEPVLGALRGEGTPGLPGFAALLHELMRSCHAPAPEARSIPRFLSLYREVLAVLGIVPDERVFTATLLRALALSAPPQPSRETIALSRDGSFFMTGAGRFVDLARRESHKHLLAALARRRIEAPGTALSWQELFEVGWSGRRAQADAARSSVYVAVASLRRAGLRDALKTHGTGYLLDPEVDVEWLEHRPRSAASTPRI